MADFVMPMSHFARVQRADNKLSAKKANEQNSVLKSCESYKSISNEKQIQKSKFEEGGKNLWILKPVGLNRGQGIHVVDSIKKCKKLINEYCLGKIVTT